MGKLHGLHRHPQDMINAGANHVDEPRWLAEEAITSAATRRLAIFTTISLVVSQFMVVKRLCQTRKDSNAGGETADAWGGSIIEIVQESQLACR